jgi:small nuclear ribonucleoprotein (snRNP)-like protein
MWPVRGEILDIKLRLSSWPSPFWYLDRSATSTSDLLNDKLNQMEDPKQAVQRSSPADFLRLILGKSVRVKLTTNLEYTGILVSLDETMNVVLEKVDEFEAGSLKRKYDEVFLRGNNGSIASLVLYINSKAGAL